MENRTQIQAAIAAQEGLRGTLDDQIIEATIAALQKQLQDLDQTPEQQRKQISMLFMDIVGSSRIGQHLDPEDTLEIMDGALKFLGEAVPMHGGRITRFMGDGFKAVFGTPVAQENDPEMAVRAGLEILELAQQYAARIKSQWGIENFQVRVGINTGLVAVGGLTEAEDTIMGSSVNLAARMESAAPPGNLLISQDTFQHVRGLFDVHPLEPITVKGFDQPVTVFLVQRLKPRALRKHARGVEGIHTTMVGRDTELQLLQDALYTAIEEGEGQVLTIVGEAGVGKSRLLAEFQDWLSTLNSPLQMFEGQSSLEARHVPYGLLRDLFTTHFHDPGSREADSSRSSVEYGFKQVFGFDLQGEMRAHILGQLLGFDYSSSPHLSGLLQAAQQLRSRALNYLVEYFQTSSRNHPVVLLLEDVHWADDSTLDIIDQLGRETPRQPLIIICLARERLFERRPFWGEGQPHHSRLHLKPLSTRQSRLLVAEILSKVTRVPTELRELVIQGSEGNPYYIEELIKTLIAQDVIIKRADAWLVETGKLAQVRLPSTLLGVLQARLDGLPGKEKAILQQASVIGRIFWDTALAVLDSGTSSEPGGQDEINQQLAALRSREMVLRRESSEFSAANEYSFKHSMLRDVAYESVLKKNRRKYHRQFAAWLIENKHRGRGEYTGLIAEHLQLAGDDQQALPFIIQAGEQAARHYANDEAITYYQKAIGIFPGQQEGIPPDHLRLFSLHERLGDVYALIGKHAAAREQFQHALALLPAKNRLALARLQRKIGSTWQDEGRYEETAQAFSTAEQALGELTSQQDQAQWQEWLWIQLNRMDGYYARADSERIVQLVEKVEPVVVEYATPQQHAAYYSGRARMYFRRDRYTVSDELLEVSRKFLAISQEIGDIQRLCDAHFEYGFTLLWFGDLVVAEDHLRRSLALAEQCSNLYSQTLCYTYLTILYRMQRDLPRTRDYIKHSIQAATARDMLNYLATARGNQAWLALHSGDLEEAEELGQQALQLWEQVPYKYPFQWTALWPLIAVAVKNSQFKLAVEYAQHILEPDQQCLPETVVGVLENGISAWENREQELVRKNLQAALRLAGEFKLL